MFELIAEGVGTKYRWRRTLPDATKIQLGRMTAPWSVQWDANISRHHLDFELSNGQLRVIKHPGATNPIFFRGEANSDFSVRPGEHFVVGNTTFTLVETNAFATQDLPDPVRQQTFSNEYLRQLPYRDANRRMQILNRMPAVIANAGDEQVLLGEFASLILAGIPLATSTGIVVVRDSDILIPHWDGQSNDVTDFQPSDRLIRSALEQSESVLHVWNTESQETPFTMDLQNDWAFVVPLTGETCRNWGVYVCGRSLESDTTPNTDTVVSIQEDMKFCELVSSTLANVLELKTLERRQTSLRPFFAPVVLSALRGRDPEDVLRPRECSISVIFCDLRGFSRTSELMAGDLIGLLAEVSHKLGTVTNQILDKGGVVGDFHGDAVMGFWGWPVVHDQSPDMGLQNREAAMTAAMEIQKMMRTILDGESPESRESAQSTRSKNATSGFGSIGIGLASGNAVVGRIGTSDQVKVTALGPVVNLASRLEGLNKKFGTRVLLDEATVQFRKRALPSERANLRRICRVQPFGLQSSYDIYELSEEPFQSTHIDQFQKGMNAFEDGDWKKALELLRPMSEADHVASYFASFILEAGSPGSDWQGIFVPDSK